MFCTIILIKMTSNDDWWHYPYMSGDVHEWVLQNVDRPEPNEPIRTHQKSTRTTQKSTRKRLFIPVRKVLWIRLHQLQNFCFYLPYRNQGRLHLAYIWLMRRVCHRPSTPWLLVTNFISLSTCATITNSHVQMYWGSNRHLKVK